MIQLQGNYQQWCIDN